jgi:hypothetical protein
MPPVLLLGLTLDLSAGAVHGTGPQLQVQLSEPALDKALTCMVDYCGASDSCVLAAAASGPTGCDSHTSCSLVGSSSGRLQQPVAGPGSQCMWLWGQCMGMACT